MKEVYIRTSEGDIQWGMDSVNKAVTLPEGVKIGDTVLLEKVGEYSDLYCESETYRIIEPPISRNWRGGLLVLPIRAKRRQVYTGDIIGRANDYSYRIKPPKAPKVLKGVFWGIDI